MSQPLSASIHYVLHQAREQLRTARVNTPELDAQVLLAFVLSKPRSHLIAWPEKLLTEPQRSAFEDLVRRRAEGEPIAHITGRREFWSLDLEVTPETLIPRPETELLVERSLELIPADAPWDIADLGTGTGAIAAAVASERPRCRVVATDRSAEALRVAEANFRRLGLQSVTVRQGSWFTPFPAGRRFHVVLSNPPYVAETDTHLREGDLPREPLGALASGSDGLDDIRRIVAQAPAYLHPGGWLLLEHGYDQGEAVAGLMKAVDFTRVGTRRDLAGLDRVTEGQMPAG